MMDVQQPDFLETQKLKNDSFPSINNQFFWFGFFYPRKPQSKKLFLFLWKVWKKNLTAIESLEKASTTFNEILFICR